MVKKYRFQRLSFEDSDSLDLKRTVWGKGIPFRMKSILNGMDFRNTTADSIDNWCTETTTHNSKKSLSNNFIWQVVQDSDTSK